MTRDELLQALTVERFGTPTPEFHGDYGVPVGYIQALENFHDDESEVS